MNALLPMASNCAPSGVGGWLATIIFGAVIGILARVVLPGKQNISALVTVILGVLGALIGYWLADAIGVCQTAGIDWLRWIVSIAVAAALVVVYGMATGKREV